MELRGQMPGLQEVFPCYPVIWAVGYRIYREMPLEVASPASSLGLEGMALGKGS